MNVIPVPKKFLKKEEALSLCGRNITLDVCCDTRLMRAAVALKNELSKRSDSFVKLTQRPEAGAGDIFVTVSDKGGDGYRIVADERGIKVSGNSPRGAFYGIQTLLQIVRTSESLDIVQFEIEDEPDFSDRGFYHDVTRGRLPKLETLKELADMLAYFKINSMQLYIEDAFDFLEFDGIMPKTDMLTAEDIIELDEYCNERFIELVPSISCFGHLYNLLQSEKYAHLCELESYTPERHYWIEKMRHHTIDASNPESLEVVKSMIDQFVGLCRSNRFNICCDETFDICKGRNAGKDAGEEYFGFVNKIIKHLESRGKTIMMWGDVVLRHEDKIGLLPKDTVVLHWSYGPSPAVERFEIFAKSGLTYYVCPGTSTWNRFSELTSCSYQNITKMAKLGYDNGATGFLNTNWGDFGNTCSLVASRYGIVLGAERGWNASDDLLGEDFEKAFTALAYPGQLSGCENIVPIIRELETCEDMGAQWRRMVDWYSATSVEGKEVDFFTDEETLHRAIDSSFMLLSKLEAIKGEGDDVCELIAAVKAVILLNRIAVRIINKDAKTVDPSAWLDEYSALWLRTSKESQLYRIKDFISTLCTL